jgi:putative GTP pyrophosphokinase
VPLPLRRTIHRVSALLETVDLEFSRVLAERSSYIEKTSTGDVDLELNVDVVAKILSEIFPPENRKDEEQYDDLLRTIRSHGLTSAPELRSVLEENRQAAIDADKQIVAERALSGSYLGTTRERIQRGVFFSHVGLARRALIAASETRAEKSSSSRKKSKPRSAMAKSRKTGSAK